MVGALRLPTLRIHVRVKNVCRAGKRSAPAAKRDITQMLLIVGRVSIAHPPPGCNAYPGNVVM